jgi:hypothetical protein
MQAHHLLLLFAVLPVLTQSNTKALVVGTLIDGYGGTSSAIA